MLFFAIVYTVEGIGQAKVGVVWQPLTHYLKETQDWDPVQIAASLAVLDVPWVVKPLYGIDFGLPAAVRLPTAQLPAAGQCRRGRRLPVDHPGAGAGSDRVRTAADGDRDGRIQHGVRRAAGGERPEASARVRPSSTSSGCGSTSRSWWRRWPAAG